MNNQSFSAFQKTLSGLALIAAPIGLLSTDLVPHDIARLHEIISKISVALLVPGAFALRQMARQKAEKTSFLGLCMVIIGLLNVATILTYSSLLQTLGNSSLAPSAQSDLAATFRSAVLPSLFMPLPLPAFELGMMVLGFALLRSRAANPALAACVIAGGLLFGMGHAGQMTAAAYAADVLWILSLAPIGWKWMRSAGSGDSASQLDWSVVRTPATAASAK